MGMFDDLVGQGNQGPKGLFGDLVPAQNEKPKSAVGEVVRQVGLTGRYALEGVPQMIDFAATPFRMATDKVINMVRPQGMPEGSSPTLSEMGSGVADWMGLPKPATAQERVVGDITRTGFGAAGGAGGAGAMAKYAGGPIAQNTLASFAANPGTQAVSGAAAGGAAGTVREEGGSPLGQALAATVAAFAAPLTLSGIKAGAGAAVDSVRKNFASPQALDATLKVELQRAGVNWDELGAAVKVQLRDDARKAIYSGEPINADALRRLADYRNIGATPLVGDITQNPALITQQRNLTKQIAASGGSGAADLPGLANENAGKVLNTLETTAKSPLDSYATGQRIIGNVSGKDAALGAAETANYKAARDAAGREIPLDRSQFVDSAFTNLAKSNKGSFLPKEVENLLNQISAGKMTINGKEFPVPFNVDTIDQLKTVLGSASRASQDGNVKAAIKQVRDALEGTQVAPMKRDMGGATMAGGKDAARMQTADELPAEALNLFDKARGAARDRRQWQESAPFIEDALSGMPPDKYVQKHVIGASVEDLAKLRKEIGGGPASTGRSPSTDASGAPGKVGDPELLNAVRKQMLDYVMKRGGGDSDTTKFSGAGFKNGFDAIGDRKWAMFFQPEEIQQIKSAINVGRYMQSQPIGSAVNNSNTAAAAFGKLSDLLAKGSNIPVIGPMFAEPVRGLAMSAQAMPLRNLSAGLVRETPKAGAKSSLVPLSALLGAPAVEDRQ